MEELSIAAARLPAVSSLSGLTVKVAMSGTSTFWPFSKSQGALWSPEQHPWDADGDLTSIPCRGTNMELFIQKSSLHSGTEEALTPVATRLRLKNKASEMQKAF